MRGSRSTSACPANATLCSIRTTFQGADQLPGDDFRVERSYRRIWLELSEPSPLEYRHQPVLRALINKTEDRGEASSIGSAHTRLRPDHSVRPQHPCSNTPGHGGRAPGDAPPTSSAGAVRRSEPPSAPQTPGYPRRKPRGSTPQGKLSDLAHAPQGGHHRTLTTIAAARAMHSRMPSSSRNAKARVPSRTPE